MSSGETTLEAARCRLKQLLEDYESNFVQLESTYDLRAIGAATYAKYMTKATFLEICLKDLVERTLPYLMEQCDAVDQLRSQVVSAVTDHVD